MKKKKFKIEPLKFNVNNNFSEQAVKHSVKFVKP